MTITKVFAYDLGDGVVLEFNPKHGSIIVNGQGANETVTLADVGGNITILATFRDALTEAIEDIKTQL